MPFKRKPVVTVGKKDWEVRVPNPPKHATHARLVAEGGVYHDGRHRVATLPIPDFKCFEGVCGWFHYIRMDKRGKVHEEYEDKWFWNGKEVEGIEDLMKD